MQTEKFEASYTYDYHLDVVNIEINQEYKHGKTIDLAFGVFLDFDENNFPVNLEIISASKIIGVKKELLIHPDGSVNIIIGEDIVSVNVTFEFEDKNETINLKTINDYGFPLSETSFALC